MCANEALRKDRAATPDLADGSYRAVRAEVVQVPRQSDSPTTDIHGEITRWLCWGTIEPQYKHCGCSVIGPRSRSAKKSRRPEGENRAQGEWPPLLEVNLLTGGRRLALYSADPARPGSDWRRGPRMSTANGWATEWRSRNRVNDP